MIPRAGLLLLALAVACARQDGRGREARARTSGDAPAPPPAADSSDGRPVILFLGTSLTAGLGLDPDSAYPAVIQRRLDSLGLAWRVANAGVSGETSAGALRRLDWILQDGVRILVVETGANDGLRGIEPESTRANLRAIVVQARRRDPALTIVLAGMEAPPNMGPRFTTRFRTVFRDLARQERLPLIPFLLDGVGGVDSLNQADGIHPTARGAVRVADNVWQVLLPLVRACDPATASGACPF